MARTYAVCPTCARWAWLPHQCPPVFGWRVDNWHGADEWVDVRARDAEEAAERAAQDYDMEDYSLLRGNDVVVYVRAPNGEVTRWNCTGESVPTYRAEQMEAGKP